MSEDRPLQKNFLTRDEAEEFLKTQEGRLALAIQIHREKCAAALAKICIELGVDLPAKLEQERLVKLLFNMTSPAVPFWKVMSESGEARVLLEKYGMSCDISQILEENKVRPC